MAQNKTVMNLQKITNILFLAALILNNSAQWFMIVAMVMWLISLVALIKYERKNGKFDFATIAYIIISVVLVCLLVYVVFIAPAINA